MAANATLREPEGKPEWTIEELSLKTGITTRNIRAYQSRGLLPPPSMDGPGRVGLYGSDHLARLRLINRMQERGFSLAGIADLLAALEEGKTLEQVLGIESAVADDDGDDAIHVSRDELLAMIPKGLNFEDVEVALRNSGLLIREGNGYLLPFPSLVSLAAMAAPAGVPWTVLLEEFSTLQKEVSGMAQRFVNVYWHHVWKPYAEAGMPREKLTEVAATLRALRTGVVEVVPPLLRAAMKEEIDAVAQRQMPEPDDASG